MQDVQQQHRARSVLSGARTTWRRGLARLARAAALLGALHAPAAWAAEPLRIAVSTGPLSLLLYVAQARGHFEAESVAVRFDECLGGNRCFSRLFDGTADLATASELPAVFAAFERDDFAIVATIASATDSPKLIGRKGVRTLGDLRGRRVGVIPQTTSQYLLDLSLLAAGVDPRTLNIVALRPEQMVDQLRSGEIDAAAVWEPIAHQALQAMKGDGTVLPNAAAYTTTFNLVAHRRLLGPRAADLTKLMRALARAEAFVAEQPRAARSILQQRLQLEPAVIDAIVPATAYRLALHQSLLATMEGEARWAQREGHVKTTKRPNFLTLVDTAALKAAKPSAVGLVR